MFNPQNVMCDMNTTSSISFYCRKSKANAAGLAPIEVCVISGGERFASTLPRRCKPAEFRKQIQSRSQNPIKEYTSAIAEKIEELKTQCLIEGKWFTKELLRTSIQYGFAEHHCTIEDLFSSFLESQQKKVDAGLSTKKNYRKYEIVRNLFFRHAGIKADANALTLRQRHIIDFNTHLLSVYDTTTVAGMMQKLKTVFLHALKNKTIQENPFMGFKICRKEKVVEFLTQEEVDRIRKAQMPTEGLEKIRDLFLFQCYTSLSYCDMMALKPSDYKTNEYGHIYVTGERLKTKVKFVTILFEDAIGIAKKYDYNLPVISNQRYNTNLKIIANICQITKPLHTHIGRHTSACYLLNKGLSMEVVARIMGHSTTKITRHYAKLLDKTVFEAVDEIMKRNPATETAEFSGI